MESSASSSFLSLFLSSVRHFSAAEIVLLTPSAFIEKSNWLKTNIDMMGNFAQEIHMRQIFKKEKTVDRDVTAYMSQPKAC